MIAKPKIAILGAGHIAGKMAATLGFLRDEVCPYAIASRDVARAEALRASSGFEKAYGSYDEMLADPAVDIVYVATPNTLHAPQVRACLDAGKHVICEKPFTTTAADAEALIAIAREKKLFLLEAVWTRFQPAVNLIKECIASGEIGEPRFIEATFGLAISHKERVASPELGGGALLDLGIYPLNFAATFFGLEFSDIASSATLSKEGVDDQSTTILKYDGGRFATLNTSISAGMGAYARISGTKGHIELPRLTRCESFIVRHVPSDESRIVDCPFDFNGYEYEIRAAVKAIREGRLECEEMTWDDSIALARLMEELRKNWGCKM